MSIRSFLFGGNSSTTSKKKSKTTISAANRSQQSQTNVSSKNSVSSQAGRTTNQQSGTSSNSGLTAGSSKTNQSGVNRQKSQLLSNSVLSGLQDLVKGQQSGVQLGMNQLQTLSSQASSLPGNFDPQAFIDSQVGASRQNFQDTVLPQLRAFDSQAGGTASTNTVADLLNQQAQGRQSVNEATIRNNASAAAQKIQDAQLRTAGGLATQLSNSTIPLLGALKGAQVSGTSQQSRQGQASQQGSQSQQGQTSQQSAGTTQQVKQMNDLIVQLAKALASGSQNQTSNTSSSGSTTSSNPVGLIGGLQQIVNLAGGPQNKGISGLVHGLNN